MLLALAVAVGALLALLGDVSGGGPAPAPPSMALKELHGEVTHIGAAGIEPAEVGMALGPGDRIATGEEGRAVISRGEQPPIRLAPNTAVRLVVADDERVELELERGQVRARVRADAAALRVTNTQEGRTRAVSARQGAFAVGVREDGLMSTEVEEGEVVVEGVDGVQTVKAGERAVAWRDGRGARTTISAEPLLDVAWPKPTAKGEVELAGQVDPGSSVRLVEPVVSASTVAGPDGQFVLRAALAEGSNRVVVEVTDPSGRARRAEGQVLRDSTGPTIKVSLDRSGR